MISMQVLGGILVALAALIGAAIALSAALWAAGSESKPGQPPHGGIRRDVPQLPQPEPDNARELVLL
jgi:hypothetical protein